MTSLDRTVRISVRVECAEEHKSQERPRRFLQDRWIEVREILDRWYQAGLDPTAPIIDYFKVLGDDGETYLLAHDRKAAAWHLVLRKPEPGET